MEEKHKKILLKTARQAIEAAITGSDEPRVAHLADDEHLGSNSGCFVTLKNNGTLRGCLGQFTSDRPLIELVAQMAAASATNDPRFLANPITKAELDQLEVEISVLSPLKRTDQPLSLRLGKDGIYIKRGFASGCFLPQVATELGWDKHEFLSYCCSEKAALPPNAWQDEQTEVYLFTTETVKAALRGI